VSIVSDDSEAVCSECKTYVSVYRIAGSDNDPRTRLCAFGIRKITPSCKVTEAIEGVELLMLRRNGTRAVLSEGARIR
jgi:hypothetical protein